MLCRNQPLQGHVRAIAIAFMCLTGIVLFCLVLKLAKTNRHDPLANFTGKGSNDVLGGIVISSIKFATCVVLQFGAEKRKLIYLYPFIVWHCLEVVSCIAGVFYGGYLVVSQNENINWTMSLVVLGALCVAIVDIWLVCTVISFHQEIRKEATQNQDLFPAGNVQFHSKGYDDIQGRSNRAMGGDHNMMGYNEQGYQAVRTSDFNQRVVIEPLPMNNQGYGDLYGKQNQYHQPSHPITSKNNQRVSFNLQSNQYMPSNPSRVDASFSEPSHDASIQNQSYMGYDRPSAGRGSFPSAQLNY